MYFTLFLFLSSTITTITQADPVIKGKNTADIVTVNTRYGKELTVRHKNEFPYIVHLEIIEEIPKKSKDVYVCGGVIISPNAVLTAAHCVVGQKIKPRIYAWAGIVHLALEKGLGHTSLVKDVKIHENFICKRDNGKDPLSDFLINDIAILWLTTAIKFTPTLQPATFAKEKTFIGKQGLIIGWGYTECGKPSSMLKSGQMTVIKHNDCQKYYDDIRITDDVFCVISNTKETGTSFGDSGGPFILNGKILGLSSFAHRSEICRKNGQIEDTCDPSKPSVFIDISKYKKWIASNLKKGPRPPSSL